MVLLLSQVPRRWVVQATVSVAHDEAVFAATATAGQQAGKKGNGPLLLVEFAGLGLPDTLGSRLEPDSDVLLPRANRVPRFFIDNAQMGNLAPDPLFWRVDAGHALAGGRVFDEVWRFQTRTPA